MFVVFGVRSLVIEGRWHWTAPKQGRGDGYEVLGRTGTPRNASTLHGK